MADKLKDALDKWSWSGGAANWNKVIEGTYGNVLGFKRGQEVVDQMREYNKQLGNVLTDDQLIDGLNKFSQQQFDQYGSGYAVDSDPFNIGRWSVATALQGVGANEAANNLIASTDARQKLTSQQAIDIGKKAQDEYAAADTQMRELAKVTGYGGGATLGDFHMKDSFGDFVLSATPLLMAAAVGGAFSPGGLFGSAGATTGAAGLDAAALATGDAMAGLIPAGELGAWTGAAGAAGTGGTLADLAGGNMDFTDLWNYGDSATQFAPDNVVDLFNNAGMPGYSNYGQSLEQLAAELFNNAGTPGFDQLGNEATGLDWLKSQFGGPGSATSNITNTIKTLTGGGTGVTGAAAGSGSGENNLMRLLGSLGSAGLGAYASNQQTSQLDEMAKRYEGYGAPYRQKLSDLYTNPDSFLKSNEVQKPVQMGTDALMRSLSTKGNPFGSGNALQQGQSYASDQLFGKLGQEKDRLAGFGGLSSYNSAAPQTATNAIQSSSNGYNAIGAGLGNIFNPPKTEAQTMADFMKMMRG